MEEKQAILRGLDEEIIDKCPLDEEKRETIEAEEISESIVESIEQIKNVIEREGDVRKEWSSSARESFESLSSNKTVCTNSDKDKSGAPTVDMRSGSPLTTVDKSTECHKMHMTLKQNSGRLSCLNLMEI